MKTRVTGRNTKRTTAIPKVEAQEPSCLNEESWLAEDVQSLDATSPGWDAKGRKAAADELLRMGIKQETIDAVYGSGSVKTKPPAKMVIEGPVVIGKAKYGPGAGLRFLSGKTGAVVKTTEGQVVIGKAAYKPGNVSGLHSGETVAVVTMAGGKVVIGKAVYKPGKVSGLHGGNVEIVSAEPSNQKGLIVVPPLSELLR